jgi:hypothetical protein
VPAWQREAEVLIADLVDASHVPWITWDAPLDGPPASLLVLSVVGCTLPAPERARMLAELAARLVAGGTLVVVDHNRPRRFAAALGALAAAPRVPGWSPRVRWRRLAYPTAREIQAAGLHVDKLALTAGERVQIVIATRASQSG